jgi:hypothetical protein
VTVISGASLRTTKIASIHQQSQDWFQRCNREIATSVLSYIISNRE